VDLSPVIVHLVLPCKTIVAGATAPRKRAAHEVERRPVMDGLVMALEISQAYEAGAFLCAGSM